MRLLRVTLSAVFLALAAAVVVDGAAAQEYGSITGMVTDSATNQPLVGVQLVVVGTNIGGISDQNGRYLLPRVPAGDRQLRAVIIGYGQETQPVQVVADQTATLDFRLSTTAVALEALVVSGVTGREQRARELGSKVATINVEEINPATVTSFSDVLGGRTEGVIMQDVNGTTGTSQRIRIRGANSLSLSNDPLIFVDGVRINSSYGDAGVGGQEPTRLNDINPNDIESIEIVKGPAASALYGTAAANGVLLITTKRGAPGATDWTFFLETGTLEDVTDYPGNFLTYQNNPSGAPVFRSNGTFNAQSSSNPTGHRYCPNIDAANGRCTQDETLFFNGLEDARTTPFSTGKRQRYGASVRGGTEAVRFFVSGQYEDETGVVDYNTQEKINFRANVDARLNDRTDLSVSFGYADNDLGLNNNDNSIFSPLINGLLSEAYFIPPSESRPDEVNDLNYGFGFNMTELRNLIVFEDVDRFTTSANARWRPTSWLSFNAIGGLDLTAQHNYETLQPDRLPIAEEYALGYRESDRTNDYLYSANLSAVGTFQLREDLLSTTTVGGSYTRDHNERTECYGSALVPGTSSCGTTAAFFDIDEDFFEIRTVGGYVQQEVAWRDKVFVAGSVRGDDNSAFGREFGFVYYPAASVSWVIAEESFFPQVSWLDNLRLRAAYGTSGLRPGFRDAVTLYAPTTVATDAGDVPGVSLSSTGNEQLEPERSTEWEFGADVGFFQDRIGIEFTYYNKESTDALIERRLPGSLGLTNSVWGNLGKVKNSGTELTARINVLNTENVGLNIGLANTTVDNEVVELGEGVEDIIFNRGLQRHKEGYSAAAFFQKPYTFSDPDGDGKLRIEDVVPGDEDEFVGVSIPKWQRSIFADLRLFDFLMVSTLFEGRGGHLTGNDTEAFRCGFRSTRGCPAVGDPNASLEQQARFIADRYHGTAIGFLEKGDFYKWRELAVTFMVPPSLADRVGPLDGLRVTLAGRNLAKWTDYSGLDPETVEGGGNSNFNQSEFNTQPPVRYFMLRLDYSFR